MPAITVCQTSLRAKALGRIFGASPEDPLLGWEIGLSRILAITLLDKRSIGWLKMSADYLPPLYRT